MQFKHVRNITSLLCPRYTLDQFPNVFNSSLATTIISIEILQSIKHMFLRYRSNQNLRQITSYAFQPEKHNASTSPHGDSVQQDFQTCCYRKIINNRVVTGRDGLGDKWPLGMDAQSTSVLLWPQHKRIMWL